VDFKHFVQLIAIGLQARIPMHMIGFPGVGKTEFTKSLETGFARAGSSARSSSSIGSIREPQDFGGFPVSTQMASACCRWPGRATRCAWPRTVTWCGLSRRADHRSADDAGGHAAALTENVCGELKLPDYEPGKGGVVYLCASNAVEWAAGGQEIQAPMANRLWHGDFPMDHETWSDMMVSDFPRRATCPSCRPTIFIDTITRSARRLPRM
jgi:hypothetical protein